jgi:hypothetical protein
MTKRRAKVPSEATNLEDFVGAAEDKIKKGVDSLLNSTHEVLVNSDMSRGARSDESHSDVKIMKIETIGLDGPQAVFRVQDDPLVLRIEVRPTGDLGKSGITVDVIFQVIDYATNAVVKEFCQRYLNIEEGSESVISQGSVGTSVTAKPTPPICWGLRPGIYIFRPLIEVPAKGILSAPERPILFKVQ